MGILKLKSQLFETFKDFKALFEEKEQQEVQGSYNRQSRRGCIK